MAPELHVARDISAEIEEAELEHARQLVGAFIAASSVPQISDYSACSWPGGQALSIVFDLHENRQARKARYIAEFERETAGEKWNVCEIGFNGEQSRAGQDQPISFRGYLERETLEQVTAYVARLWPRCTAHPFVITNVITNRSPPSSRSTDDLKSNAADVVYEISIRDLSPRQLSISEPAPNALTIATASSSDHTYTVRLTVGDDGRFLTTRADCANGANCDPDLLACLRSALDQPVDSTELDKPMQDALAVLPAAFRGAQPLNRQTLMLGSSEMFFVTFAEVPVSESRKESVSVTCSRLTGTHGNWNCQHRVETIVQQVPGQTREVRLHDLMFSESEVTHIVTELRRQLVAHPTLCTENGVIDIFSIQASSKNYSCHFYRGPGLWKAGFRYDDDVSLDSIELVQRFPEEHRGT
jgi:hypothetical protein